MEHTWWKHGVIYQIYPRSFADTNDDGIGDLKGILAHLDHLAFLGVDGLWLSPTFPSPMKDFGYDVSDYRGVDERFGTLDDMDALLNAAHAKNIRVMLDLVPNHSSDVHPWFTSSRAAKESPHRDHYVWKPAHKDGGPPNNWVSYFGGPAWTLDEKTNEYFLHSFLAEQPDLNWRNPVVEKEMHDVVRFWLDRGVDGFRIDVIHKIAKDPGFRDNPNIEGGKGYFAQIHQHDENHPDIHGYLRRLRTVFNEYQDRASVGEVYIFNPDDVAKYYGDDDELHLAFNFSFLRASWSAASFRAEVEGMEALLRANGWPVYVLSNHDVVRHASRYGDVRAEARSRMAAMLLLTLRGTPFLYAGEEIGMRDVDVPDAQRQDPVFWTMGREFSRDGCRAPIPWTDEKHGGFTTGTPWLPMAADIAQRNVAAMKTESSSLLWLYRNLISLRRQTPALHRGTYRTLPTDDDVFAFERVFDQGAEGGRARVFLNFGDDAKRIDVGADVENGICTNPATSLGREITLGPDEGVVIVLKPG